MKTEKLTILFPWQERVTYKQLSDEAIHDLGLEELCNEAGTTPQERRILLRTLSNLTRDVNVANFRAAVFADLFNHKQLREKLLQQLRQVEFLQEYGGMRNNSFDEDLGIWDLLHRLDEIRNYIICIETLRNCLSDADITSEGLINLRISLNKLYEDHDFAVLKEDVNHLKAETGNLKSVTVGINLNERFEAQSFGLVSINSKAFTKSSVISGFADAILGRDSIQKDTAWRDNYKYHPSENASGVGSRLEAAAGTAMMAMNPLAAMTLSAVPSGNGVQSMMQSMDSAANAMLTALARHLRNVLHRYVSITVQDIIGLIPQFLYYIRMTEYIEKKMAAGWVFSQAEAKEGTGLCAKGFYNLKLINAVKPEETVKNDLDFDDDKRMYILTGANRGGKTTVTQAVGQLYVLAQGGVFIPGESMEYGPVDNICTHFPADEDKTLDYGRLGEECRRFRELYIESTPYSLMLLNETFSTTSFEEGYEIALDACRALLKKGLRTLYNTHMHKLASDLQKINGDQSEGKAYSLVAASKNGQRSFKVQIGPPEGTSLAHDIAEKYGVTFEQLIDHS